MQVAFVYLCFTSDLKNVSVYIQWGINKISFPGLCTNIVLREKQPTFPDEWSEMERRLIKFSAIFCNFRFFPVPDSTGFYRFRDTEVKISGFLKIFNFRPCKRNATTIELNGRTGDCFQIYIYIIPFNLIISRKKKHRKPPHSSKCYLPSKRSNINLMQHIETYNKHSKYWTAK